MIAIISSTVMPSESPSHDGPRTNLDPSTRFAQTVGSVQSLVRLGFDVIIVADNSPTALTAQQARELAPARLYQFQHYPYRNKGIAEARLILAASEYCPNDVPIMKLSGRYSASRNLTAELSGADFAGRFSSGSSNNEVSTRAYAVRDRAFLQRFLNGTLNELYAAPWRVVGPRSMLALVKRLLYPSADTYPYSDPPVSLEYGSSRWLVRSGAKVRRLEEIGVEGVMGSWINPSVKE